MKTCSPLPRKRAFTLVELLVVMAIMAILISVTVLGLRGLNNAGQFNKALYDISGVLEQGRAYAIAQNTYVWVVFYEVDPGGAGRHEVFVRGFASSDGTDPFGWSAGVALPTVGVDGPTLSPISQFYRYTGLHLQTTSLPNAPSGANFPAVTPDFQCTAPGASGPIALSKSCAVYWIVEFTPSGSARNGANPIDSIWLGLQPMLSATVYDTKNIASLKVNGMTGLTTMYRP